MLKMSAEDMQRLLEEGQIPAYKVGRNWKIPIKCLEEFVITKAIIDTEERKNEALQDP